MKKILLSFVLVISLILLSGFASAVPVACTENTIVDGTIYQNVITNPIANANVAVICHHNSFDYTKNVVSGTDGSYSALFQCWECDLNDQVTVNAQKDSLTGTNEGSVTMTYNLLPTLKLNIGVVDVPMVPEFGLAVGVLTIFGAVGMFFLVRRK